MCECGGYECECIDKEIIFKHHCSWIVVVKYEQSYFKNQSSTNALKI